MHPSFHAPEGSVSRRYPLTRSGLGHTYGRPVRSPSIDDHRALQFRAFERLEFG